MYPVFVPGFRSEITRKQGKQWVIVFCRPLPLGTPTFFHTKMCLFSMPWCYQHWVIWRCFRILCDKMCDTFGRPCPPEPSLLILNIPFPCRGRLRIVPKRLSALSRTSLIFLSRSPSYRGHLHHRPLQTSQSPCRGVFCVRSEEVQRRVRERGLSDPSSGSKSAGYRVSNHPHPIFYPIRLFYVRTYGMRNLIATLCPTGAEVK